MRLTLLMIAFAVCFALGGIPLALAQTTCRTDANCNDGIFCNGIESCNQATGRCVALSACPPFLDGCVMRGAICDEVNDQCLDAPNDSLCDDGVFCNGTESCDAATGQCVALSACPPFLDGCVMRGAICDEANDQCLDAPNDGLCNDGVFCNGTETCDAATGQCVAVSACPPFVDGCVTRNAICNEDIDQCEDMGDNSLCDDGLFCNGVETCNLDTGTCAALSPCPPFLNGCVTAGGCNEEQDKCLTQLNDDLCKEGLVCAPSGDCLGQALPPPRDFPTAVQGAGSSTQVVFFSGPSTATQSEIFAEFLNAMDGSVVDAQQATVGPNENSSFMFTNGNDLRVGHINFVAPPNVIPTAIMRLNIPMKSLIPPIGVGPAGECRKPAATLIRDVEFDTGVALSSNHPDPVTCEYDIYLSANGTLVYSDNALIAPSGQWQGFPLSQFEALPGQYNIQFNCSMTVHGFSLFQKSGTGELFSNGIGCLDE